MSAADDARRWMLSGVNVVECGEGVAAAFGAKMMADLGANVSKSSRRRETSRGVADLFRTKRPIPRRAGFFFYLNNNKRGVTLDLTNADGVRLLGKLLAKADVLIHNVHPRDRAARRTRERRDRARVSGADCRRHLDRLATAAPTRTGRLTRSTWKMQVGWRSWRRARRNRRSCRR